MFFIFWILIIHWKTISYQNFLFRNDKNQIYIEQHEILLELT